MIEALCHGTRSIVARMDGGALPIRRVMLTRGRSSSNPLFVSVMADVLGRDLEVPDIDTLTAVGLLP